MTRRKCISLLVPDISAPVVGAALKLASYLERQCCTEIVGPDFGAGVCSLYKGAYPFKAIPAGRLYRLPDYVWERRRLARAVTGDLVIAVKAYADTIPVALEVKRRRNVPICAYLDEWDGAQWSTQSLRQKGAHWLRHFHHPMEEHYVPWVERMLCRTDQVLSTTTFLQKRFGGTVLHAGVDCTHFTPKPRKEVEALRRQLGLADARVIVFGGVVRPHKGVEDILEALAVLDDKQYRLLVAGPLTEHLRCLLQMPRYAPFITVAGAPLEDRESTINSVVHAQMPLYLDAGDLVVLALRDTPLAQSQMPIKVFEAMAMGKPIVSSAVADLPLVLEGCGEVVPPGNVKALAEVIEGMLSQPEKMQAMGAAARETCLRRFSREQSERTLSTVINRLLER